MVLMPIDMPSNCWDCPCHDGEFLLCQLFEDGKKDWEIEQDLGKKRRDNCPLIEMHTQKVMSMSEQEIKEFRKYINGDWSEYGYAKLPKTADSADI